MKNKKNIDCIKEKLIEMEKVTQKEVNYLDTMQFLHCRTEVWLSEIDFIRIEQKFLKELLTEHIMGLCDAQDFTTGKLLLNGINQEINIGDNLTVEINEHKINLSLFLDNIYRNKESDFRESNKYLKKEVKNYIDNFRNIKKQVFELVLYIMKKEKNSKKEINA